MKTEDITEEQLDAIFAMLAQGVINICEGLTTIENESRVHRAMSALCELRNAGRLSLLTQREAAEEIDRQKRSQHGPKGRQRLGVVEPIYPTLTRAQAQCTAEGATRFSMRGSLVLAHRPSNARPGQEATCAIVQQEDGQWRCEGWVA